jgi:hypothetical protein
MTIKASNIDVNLLQVGRLEDSSSVSSQRVAWVNYETSNKKLHIQTPAFITETYGIPREGPYYQNDKQRAFYKLPFCHGRSLYADQIDYAGIEKFYNKMLELDKYFGSEEMKLQLFGDKLSTKYEYQPIVRHPDIEDEMTDEGGTLKKIAYRPPYSKIKLALSNDDEEVPLFRLFDRKDDGAPEEIPLCSFRDVTQHMRYLTKHRVIFELQKIYAMKNGSGSEKRKYGLTLKMVVVECTNKHDVTNNKCVDLFDDY